MNTPFDPVVFPCGRKAPNRLAKVSLIATILEAHAQVPRLRYMNTLPRFTEGPRMNIIATFTRNGQDIPGEL